MASIQKHPENNQGRVSKLKRFSRTFGGPLNVGFVGIDSALRMKDGESAPVAVGKALLTNAAFSLIPGGIVGVAALGAAMAAPEINNAMYEASRNLNMKKSNFNGGSFQESESQLMLMNHGLNRIENARAHVTRKMANHARGAQKIY